ELIPDDLMCEVVVRRLKKDDCRAGFILDGFPRTRVQADSLEKTLAKEGWKLNGCVYFNIPRAVLLERLTGRLNCKKCGAIFHRSFSPPKGGMEVCDRCGGELYQRDDDTEEAVARRLDVYEESTRELVDYFRSQGRSLQIEAQGSVEEVERRLEDGLFGS
ncbi:MAG: nucleoside monophosphate kinase, partial [Planctomycetes bacterium]|nr:nucleoside monophosphate kinase [Planctomycetota bacterium]